MDFQIFCQKILMGLSYGDVWISILSISALFNWKCTKIVKLQWKKYSNSPIKTAHLFLSLRQSSMYCEFQSYVGMKLFDLASGITQACFLPNKNSTKTVKVQKHILMTTKHKSKQKSHKECGQTFDTKLPITSISREWGGWILLKENSLDE